jgi:hypothetical protein
LKWQGLSIKEWWSILTYSGIPNRKAMSSLAMLVISNTTKGTFRKDKY